MEKASDSRTSRALGPSGEAGLQEQVARLAYALWESRGWPMGSPESAWYGAEQSIRPKSPTVVVGRPSVERRRTILGSPAGPTS